MRLVYALLLIAGIFGKAFCVTENLIIEGNKELSREVILESASAVECADVDSLCVVAVCRAVASRYWESGYLGAEVECDRLRPDGDTILISVFEGSISRLESVRIVGSEAFGESELGGVFEDDIGSAFSPWRLEQGIRTLLEFYDQNGYPAASVLPEMFSAGEGRLDVTLRVDEGPRAKVGQVTFDGLTKTRPEILRVEAGIPVGKTYDGRKIGNARARLQALGVFEKVSEPMLSFWPGDTLVAVGFEVVEAKTNRVEGLVAYAPSQEEGKLIGSLDMELGNIAGTLRRLRVLYDRPGPNRLRWSIRYREPRLAGVPVALDAGVLSDVIEDSYARRKFSLGIRFRREATLELGFGGFLGVTKDRSGKGTDGDFGERGVSFDLRYDARDPPLNPRSGGFMSLSHETGRLDFDRKEAEDRTLYGLGVKVEYILGLAGNNVAAMGAGYQGVFSSTDRVPSSHIVRLGGAGSLRGYPEEWFSVEESLVLTLEARRVLGGTSRIYAFIDAATFRNGTRRFGELEQLPFGYGVGFVGGSRSGIFRMEIALGRGDGFSDAKLHLGLVRRF
jgi:outer membrane protein assembly factor BamA